MIYYFTYQTGKNPKKKMVLPVLLKFAEKKDSGHDCLWECSLVQSFWKAGQYVWESLKYAHVLIEPYKNSV